MPVIINNKEFVNPTDVGHAITCLKQLPEMDGFINKEIDSQATAVTILQGESCILKHNEKHKFPDFLVTRELITCFFLVCKHKNLKGELLSVTAMHVDNKFTKDDFLKLLNPEDHEIELFICGGSEKQHKKSEEDLENILKILITASAESKVNIVIKQQLILEKKYQEDFAINLATMRLYNVDDDIKKGDYVVQREVFMLVNKGYHLAYTTQDGYRKPSFNESHLTYLKKASKLLEIKTENFEFFEQKFICACFKLPWHPSNFDTILKNLKNFHQQPQAFLCDAPAQNSDKEEDPESSEDSYSSGFIP